jgi:hypothetical protein
VATDANPTIFKYRPGRLATLPLTGASRKIAWRRIGYHTWSPLLEEHNTLAGFFLFALCFVYTRAHEVRNTPTYQGFPNTPNRFYALMSPLSQEQESSLGVFIRAPLLGLLYYIPKT